MASAAQQFSYDVIPYPGYPILQTHPDRLATHAALRGLRPAAPESCRVLELACGDGGNLIPMAFTYPGSAFVGVDLSGNAIRQANDAVAALGLANIRFHHMDAMDITPAFGAFDYVIAYGMYSWVPPAVQVKVLQICKANLASEGIAYVSYNCLPGGHLRAALREMLLFHVRSTAGPKERIAQACSLGRFLAEGALSANEYQHVFEAQVRSFSKHGEAEIYHDMLADFNEALYFHQFMERATGHGLQFVAEADLFEMQTHLYPQPICAALQQLQEESELAKEQYTDFLKFRSFRQTLLCHAERKLQRPSPEQVGSLWFSSVAKPENPAPDFKPRTIETFIGEQGARASTDSALGKAAFWHLGRIAPRRECFPDLLKAASSIAGQPATADDEVQLLKLLFETAYSGLVRLHFGKESFTLSPGDSPEVSRLARWQFRHRERGATLNHEAIEIADVFSRHIIQLLDGARTREALVEELAKLAEAGQADFSEDGHPLQGERLRILLTRLLDDNLQRLASMGLLVK